MGHILYAAYKAVGALVSGTARKASDIPATGFLPVDEWIDLETFSLEEGPRLYRDIAESKIKIKPVLIP